MSFDINTSNAIPTSRLLAATTSKQNANKIKELNTKITHNIKLDNKTTVKLSEELYQQYIKEAKKKRKDPDEYIYNTLYKKYYPNKLKDQKKDISETIFNKYYKLFEVTEKDIKGYKGHKTIKENTLRFIKACLDEGVSKSKLRNKFHINDHKIQRAIDLN